MAYYCKGIGGMSSCPVARASQERVNNRCQHLGPFFSDTRLQPLKLFVKAMHCVYQLVLSYGLVCIPRQNVAKRWFGRDQVIDAYRYELRDCCIV